MKSNQPCFIGVLCVMALSAAACGKPSGDKQGADTGDKKEAAPAAEPLILRPGFSRGKITISGVISAPVELPAGAEVVLSVQEERENFSPRFDFGDKGKLKLKAAAKSIPFEIKGIEAGKYHFAAIVHKDPRETIGDGDWVGFHGGTVGAHIQEPAKSVVIEIKEGSPQKVDVAIGQVKCRAKFGEACTEDDDCRGTKCLDGKGGWVTAFPQSCDSATKKCKALTCSEGQKLEEGDCL